ncbi:hypothetical protein B0T22DRAFT_35266 [Podospora appendiculata]|uniref:Uncharacterized protein n=1 Tax=Podospora appendiculata TaxID=314037 RepID=A0AAE0XH60_9PEZI|nr:hypothetical protein B0T22DRAFT_35266 [Podospora appendiculata]
MEASTRRTIALEAAVVSSRTGEMALLLFMKICLPYPRFTTFDHRCAAIYAPLNLTAFLRLIVQMHEVGYPAHWLSGMLGSICSGSITTTARAPRVLVADVKDVSKRYSAKAINMAPWRAEFNTLLSLWRPLLPFGLPPSDHREIVPVGDIHKCCITFRNFHAITRRCRISCSFSGIWRELHRLDTSREFCKTRRWVIHRTKRSGSETVECMF